MNNLIPDPHPLKSVFKKLGFPQILIAKHLGIGLQSVNAILNNHKAPTKDQEVRLNKLVKEIELFKKLDSQVANLDGDRLDALKNHLSNESDLEVIK